MVEHWSYDYNFNHPHATPGQKTPVEMATVIEDKISDIECSNQLGGLQVSFITLFYP